MPFLRAPHVARLDVRVRRLWFYCNWLPHKRLASYAQRARARLDRPPREPLGAGLPTREHLIAHLKTAGRRFAREYWAEGLPLFFPDLDLGPVPSEFLHVPK